jgi:His-Xaa-Ser system protein HxsD
VTEDAPATESTRVHFAADIFDIDAIKRAAYRLSDKLIVEIAPVTDGIDCVLRATTAKQNLSSLETEFRNHVLDYDLRARIAKETEPLRNLVLSLAFSKTGLQPHNRPPR